MNMQFSPPVSDQRKQGRDFYWAQAKRFGQAGFTIGELHAKTRGVTYTTVKLYVHALRDIGAVVRIGTKRSRGNGAHQAVLYAVVRSVADPTERMILRPSDKTGRRQQQLWTAMRAVPQFMVRELAAVASTDDIVVSLTLTRTYVTKLLRAGLLQVMIQPRRSPDGLGGSLPGTYRLKPSANTGPAAPRILGHRVYDRNKRDFVGHSTDGSEVSA